MNSQNDLTLPVLLRQNRSYRRFGGEPLTEDVLKALISCCTLTPSAGNLQKLRFCPVFGKERCESVYPTLRWAGYLTDWDGPCEDERPRGYIVLLCRPDEENTLLGMDVGICAQSMLLAATERGLGGCMIRNVQSDELLSALGLSPAEWRASLVIALGEPIEQVEIVPVGEDGSIRYFRDEAGVHYVPKRALEDIMV